MITNELAIKILALYLKEFEWTQVSPVKIRSIDGAFVFFTTLDDEEDDAADGEDFALHIEDKDEHYEVAIAPAFSLIIKAQCPCLGIDDEVDMDAIEEMMYERLSGQLVYYTDISKDLIGPTRYSRLLDRLKKHQAGIPSHVDYTAGWVRWFSEMILVRLWDKKTEEQRAELIRSGSRSVFYADVIDHFLQVENEEDIEEFIKQYNSSYLSK